ncbi:MAG: hypothetical protein P4L85_11835 [Paludisphaera borealis]|uniref:hypothetical protein n=1 Tax=Paludisphaera borealis TaxID=1387353 RepID=UPI002841D2DA|nr:hypothetical protein [Paludisphaera borealis]MDR3620032.1 hypothetical protein [Paludisphaera borealis]
MSLSIHPPSSSSGGDEPGFGTFRDPRTFVRVFVGAFLRDVHSFYPGCRIEPVPAPGAGRLTVASGRSNPGDGLGFEMADEDGDRTTAVWVSLFGTWHRLVPERPLGLGAQDRRLIRAVAAVLELNFQILFRRSRMSILQLRRGMPEDHYVAACLEPSAYAPAASATSRIAEAILTLRTMALSTYENRRVTTGALILGLVGDRGEGEDRRPAPPEALDFGVELTSLKSLHRLCDGRRTLFLVDRDGKLADVVDIRRWAGRDDQALADETPARDVPCARSYSAHARATRGGGDVCLVLSPNQEIKVFADGMQAFVFAHGRWRVLDPESKFAVWQAALSNPRLARILFQAALDLAEERQGGLLVVVDDPSQAIGRLLAPQDVLDFEAEAGGEPEPDPEPGPTALQVVDPWSDAATTGEPVVEALTKGSIRYLAGNRSLLSLDASVVEALASLDGALVTDGDGRLLAFGAILRHDAHSRIQATAEGARTTAAIVASRYGPVLKVSEDGIVSCFLGGERVWDL